MKVLVCGSRDIKLLDYYAKVVWDALDKLDKNELEIIEGCCLHSADEYAERWAERNNIKIHHFPATQGNFLRRNIEMVKQCDIVLAFWNGFSYGTAQTIASAVRINKPITIFDVGFKK